jgi:hypothetical protein
MVTGGKMKLEGLRWPAHRGNNYLPWYVIIWRAVWVVPLYLSYGVAVLFAVIAFLDVKAAVQYIRR